MEDDITMVRWADSRLGQRQAHVVVGHIDDLAAHAPHPRSEWRWSDIELSHECLYNLKEAGLIEPVTGRSGGEWRTTEDLWVEVRERSDLTVESLDVVAPAATTR